MTQSWPKHDMSFLAGRRMRRLRQTEWSRSMVRETELLPRDLIWPLFVIEGQNEKTQIKTMPGVERLSIDLMVDAAVVLARLWGMSELVIGLTVVAVGTSLPELASSLIAAIRIVSRRKPSESASTERRAAALGE